MKVLRSVEGRNGYEVYRQLLKLYTPNTKPRSMAILSAIMSHPCSRLRPFDFLPESWRSASARRSCALSACSLLADTSASISNCLWTSAVRIGSLSSSDPSGPTPMEIDRFESKRKGKTNAQKGKGNGKGKGKGVPFRFQKGFGKQSEQLVASLAIGSVPKAATGPPGWTSHASQVSAAVLLLIFPLLCLALRTRKVR